ncbi:hypothetical protein D3C75_565030 [compost metagenome]
MWSQGFNTLIFEQILHLHAIAFILKSCDYLDGFDRIAAYIEEFIIHAWRTNAQNLRPYIGQQHFMFIAGRANRFLFT